MFKFNFKNNQLHINGEDGIYMYEFCKRRNIPFEFDLTLNLDYNNGALWNITLTHCEFNSYPIFTKARVCEDINDYGDYKLKVTKTIQNRLKTPEEIADTFKNNTDAILSVLYSNIVPRKLIVKNIKDPETSFAILTIIKKEKFVFEVLYDDKIYTFKPYHTGETKRLYLEGKEPMQIVYIYDENNNEIGKIKFNYEHIVYNKDFFITKNARAMKMIHIAKDLFKKLRTRLLHDIDKEIEYLKQFIVQ